MASRHIFTGFNLARNHKLRRIIRADIGINICQITPERNIRRLTAADQELSHIGIVTQNTGLEDRTTLFRALEHIGIENFWDNNVRNASSRHCNNLSEWLP